MSETKQCSKCKEQIPLANFSFNNKAKGTLDHRCKSCVQQVKKDLAERGVAAKEYPVYELDLENTTEWQVGKPYGGVIEYPTAYTARIIINNVQQSKTFTFSKYPSKEAAKEAAENWQWEMSNEHRLTRNRIKVIDENTIKVELTKGCVMTTDMQFSDTIQKHSLVAGKSGNKGAEYYAIIVINRKNVMFHKYITGFHMTDHINRDPMDNRLVNLRKADHKLNNNNRGVNKIYQGTDHIMGIRFVPKDNSFQARIKQCGKEHTGSFSVNKYGYEEAKRLAIEYRERLCKEFQSNNKN